MSAARIRLQRDIEGLDIPPTVTLDIIHSPEDPNEQPLIHILIVPDDGFYRGGHFKFSFKINENYPIDPPKVVCMNKIFHPNIDIQGKICLNILREDWTPVLELQTVIIGLLFLFLEPNPLDPLNKEAAELLKTDITKFKHYVDASMVGQWIGNVKYDTVL